MRSFLIYYRSSVLTETSTSDGILDVGFFFFAFADRRSYHPGRADTVSRSYPASKPTLPSWYSLPARSPSVCLIPCTDHGQHRFSSCCRRRPPGHRAAYLLPREAHDSVPTVRLLFHGFPGHREKLIDLHRTRRLIHSLMFYAINTGALTM